MKDMAMIKAVASVLMLLALMPFASQAAAVTYVGSHYPDFSRFGLGVVGDAGENRITVAVEGDDPMSYVLEDPTGVDARTNCVNESPTVARCAQRGGVNISAKGGDDIVRIDIPFPGLLVGGAGSDLLIGGGGDDKLRGGTSADTLKGRAGADRIFGDEGRDRLIGGPGRDMLKGGPGRDVFRGGAGDDVLRAVDGERDRVIDCGPGKRDIAYIDRGLDPEPIGCERVKYGNSSG